MTIAAECGRYVANLSIDQAPVEVVRHLKSALLYTLTVTVAGFDGQDQPYAAVKRSMRGAGGSSRLLVTGESRRAVDAAFVNAVLSCARGQNDTNPGAFAHGGCFLVPAVLAMAEDRGASGKAALEALLVGYELLPKLASDASQAAASRGLRATSVLGPVVAAGAIAKLIGLDERQVAHAVSIATQFAGGTLQCWTEATPEWRFMVGHSARSGIEAALLAEAGATAADSAFEGDAGYYRALFGSVPKVSFTGWDTTDTIFKPYPGNQMNQGAIHILRGMLDTGSFQAEEVRSIEVALASSQARYPGVDQYGPFAGKTGAVMSLPFMVTTLLQKGTVRAEDFRCSYGEHPIHALSRMVHLHERAHMPAWGCELQVHLKDGRVLTGSVPDQRCFAYDWDGTVSIMKGVSDEWQVPDSPARFARLRNAVDQFEESGSATDLVDCCISSTEA